MTGILLKGHLQLHGHDAPLGDELAEHGFVGHGIEILIPEGRILPLVGFRVVPGAVVRVGHLRILAEGRFLAEGGAVAVGVVDHLLSAPIQRFPEAVQVLKHGKIADSGGLFPLVIVRDRAKLDVLCQRVEAEQLPGLYGNHVEPLVAAGAEGELDIAFVAHLELGILAALLPVFVGYQVILPQLGRGGKSKGFTEECAGKDG